MEASFYDTIDRAILCLAGRIQPFTSPSNMDSGDAVKFSQAALNLAHTKEIMYAIEVASGHPPRV